MNNYFVSILMPVYNTARYLHKAIESVLNQTYSNFELIIINDGSTDTSEEIVKSFSDKRIVYIKKENTGVAHSLNRGLVVSNGELIWRHDSDDVSNKQALEKQVKFLMTHKDLVLVSTQIAFMSDNGKIAYKYRNPKNNFFEEKYFKEVTKDNYWQTRPIIHATILVFKKVLLEVGGYRVQFPTSEDIDLWFRILEKHKAAVIHECNYFVRLHQSSNTYYHGEKNKFYRELAYTFFQERKQTKSDPIIRGEKMPFPSNVIHNDIEQANMKQAKSGKLYRNDILEFRYLIYINAKDYKLIFKAINVAIRDGWKLKRTWKAILFPIFGHRIVHLGVKIKQRLKHFG